MKIKKNTYVINMDKFCKTFADCFVYAKNVPLPLLSVNGSPVLSHDIGIPTKMFPNPHTTEMLFNFYYSVKIPHTFLSTTIVEYCTKQNRPVAYLFPNGSVFYTELKPNSGIRRDLAYQIQLRKSLIQSKQK